MRKKLALNVEELRVEQFQVEAAAAEKRGTVRGYSDVCETSTCVCGIGPSEPHRICAPMPDDYTVLPLNC